MLTHLISLRSGPAASHWEISMARLLWIALITSIISLPAAARVLPYPSSFHGRLIQTNGTELYVRTGGSGPTVVLLHGYGETGDMWEPLAVKLAVDHTVIVPDLRGMGLSCLLYTSDAADE